MPIDLKHYAQLVQVYEGTPIGHVAADLLAEVGHARNAALEDAAKVAETRWSTPTNRVWAEDIAAAIRKLKEKADGD